MKSVKFNDNVLESRGVSNAEDIDNGETKGRLKPKPMFGSHTTGKVIFKNKQITPSLVNGVTIKPKKALTLPSQLAPDQTKRTGITFTKYTEAKSNTNLDDDSVVTAEQPWYILTPEDMLANTESKKGTYYDIKLPYDLNFEAFTKPVLPMKEEKPKVLGFGSSSQPRITEVSGKQIKTSKVPTTASSETRSGSLPVSSGTSTSSLGTSSSSVMSVQSLRGGFYRARDLEQHAKKIDDELYQLEKKITQDRKRLATLASTLRSKEDELLLLKETAVIYYASGRELLEDMHTTTKEREAELLAQLHTTHHKWQQSQYPQGTFNANVNKHLHEAETILQQHSWYLSARRKAKHSLIRFGQLVAALKREGRLAELEIMRAEIQSLCLLES